jgi:hypothetical protein
MQNLSVRKAGSGEALVFGNLGMGRHSWVLEEMTQLIGTRRWFETTRTGFSEKDRRPRSFARTRYRAADHLKHIFERLRRIPSRSGARRLSIKCDFFAHDISPSFLASSAED